MVELLRQRKDQLLARLNREYRYSGNKLQRIGSIEKENSDNSLKSLEDTRSEYIEKLKMRIKQLEQGTSNKLNRSDTMESEPVSEKLKSPENPSLLQRLIPVRPKTSQISKETPKQNEDIPISFLKKSSGPDISSKPAIEEHDSSMKLATCQVCNRKFRSERIAIHQNTCSIIKKKRPVFDEKKMRLRNTEMENYTNQSKVQVSTRNPFAPAKEATGSCCPHCKRHFNPDSLIKHVHICKNLTSKPKREPFRTKHTLP